MFVNVLLMLINIPALEKKAIKQALDQDWEGAVETNTQILQEIPTDTNAKIRLGRAYLQTKNFKAAEKLFKEVLSVDPINKIASKNYELAKNKTTTSNGGENAQPVIKEPGTTTEVSFDFISKSSATAKLVPGDTLALKIVKTQVSFIWHNKILGVLKEKTLINKLYAAKEKNLDLSAVFVKSDTKTAVALIRCLEPIFKGYKQNIKPYMKKGSIKEPEMELDSFEEEEEQEVETEEEE